VSCCPPKGYEKLFGERSARRDVRRYRRKGLDDTARRMVEFLRARGLDGATVLEIGGGVGAIEVELLEAGAERAVNVELSPYYEKTARELWREAGVEDRTDYVVADVAADGADVGRADAVVMHRVICCYPDYDALMDAAAERAGRYLVLSFPRDRFLTRSVFGAMNLVARLLRWEYRNFIRPAPEILAAARRRGLEPVFEGTDFVWHVAALERTGG
jgi:2-polyprenyl-3-methyl-5-hydroxy-6-metoxy-1,4-benzoquinol methylase